MSYILEALRKAGAERRADTPQPARLPPGFGTVRPGPRRKQKRQQIALAAMALLALAAGGAWYAGDDARRHTVKEELAEPPSASAPVAALPAAPAPAASAPPVPAADPPAKPKEMPAKKAPEKRRLRVPPAKPADEAPRSATTATRADEAALPTLRDLPEPVRREIPALTVGGYIYSGNRADRSVLINKRLLREGDEIAPGLRLEQMMQNGMILNYKGYRYRASY